MTRLLMLLSLLSTAACSSLGREAPALSPQPTHLPADVQRLAAQAIRDLRSGACPIPSEGRSALEQTLAAALADRETLRLLAR